MKSCIRWWPCETSLSITGPRVDAWLLEEWSGEECFTFSLQLGVLHRTDSKETGKRTQTWARAAEQAENESMRVLEGIITS